MDATFGSQMLTFSNLLKQIVQNSGHKWQLQVVGTFGLSYISQESSELSSSLWDLTESEQKNDADKLSDLKFVNIGHPKLEVIPDYQC